MSFFSKIIVNVEQFFKNTGTDLEKFAASFMKLFGKAPAVLNAIQNFIGELAPIITAAVALAAPEIEPEVAAALAAAETGLAAIDASATAAVTGTSLLTQLQNFSATVPALLTGLDVKDAALKTKITSIVNLINSEAKVLIPAVEAAVTSAKTATAV